MPPTIVTKDEREAAALSHWLSRGYQRSTIGLYLRWVRRLQPFLVPHRKRYLSQLTCRRVVDAARRYARVRRINEGHAVSGARIAHRAWSDALRATGYRTPAWTRPSSSGWRSALWDEYVVFSCRTRGVAESTLRLEYACVAQFAAFLKTRHRSFRTIRVQDIDHFVAKSAQRYAPKTLERMCSELRAFLRFLHARSQTKRDLAQFVSGPIIRRYDRPRRGLDWDNVRRILGAVDRSTATGRRDYALLLLMAAYGLGAGEALHLRLEDIAWEPKPGTLRIVRPKTGVHTTLPLLPTVAVALAAYLSEGRPRVGGVREVFLRSLAPYHRLSCAGAVGHILRKYANLADVHSQSLSSHVLRHSHAMRQVELGARPKVISDILGHSDPESLSAYVRISTERLRRIALPVPK